jgi:Acetyltransferase (GNAT) domain
MSARSISHPSQSARVREASPGDPAWLEFVQNEPRSTVYHHPAWFETLRREYSHDGVCLLCEGPDGRPRGILPMLYTRGVPLRLGGELTARRLSSLPRTPVAGPLATDEQALKALLEVALKKVEAEDGLRLQLKLGGPELDGLVEGLTPKPWRLSYVVALPDREEELRFGNARNQARITWSVRHAQKNGVAVRAAETEEDLGSWYGLYLETMRFHAVPPRPYRLFAAIWELLRPQGLMRLLLAERRDAHGTHVIAGVLLLMFGETVFYAFAGVNRRDLGLRPNELLQWHAIHDACREGFRRYDLGEVDDENRGLAAFKTKWGSEPYRLYRYYYPPPTPGGSAGGRFGRFALRFGYAAWRRLPIRATTALGERIYAHL